MIRPPWLPAGHPVHLHPPRRTIPALHLSSPRDADARRLRLPADLSLARAHFSQARANVSLLSARTQYKSRVPPTILPLRSPARRFLRVQVGMASARPHSTHENDSKSNGVLKQRKTNGHNHEHEHDHSHSHSLFGHSHSHGEEGHSHSHDAEQIIAALKGSSEFVASGCMHHIITGPCSFSRPGESNHPRGPLLQHRSDGNQGYCWMVFTLCVPSRRRWSFTEW